MREKGQTVRSSILVVLTLAAAVPGSAQERRSAVPAIDRGVAVLADHVITAQGPRPAGIAWGSGLLWVVDAEERAVRAVDPFDGDAVAPMITLGHLSQPGAAAFDPEAQVLWVIDDPQSWGMRHAGADRGRGTRWLVRIPVTDPDRSCVLPMPAYADTGPLSGVGWDGEAPWICMRGGLCAALFRIDPATDSGVDLATSAGCDPLGLAIDPAFQSLWMVAAGVRDQGAVLIERSLTGRRDLLGRPVSVLATKSVLGLDPDVRPTAIAATGRAVWVLDAARRQLLRYDLAPGAE